LRAEAGRFVPLSELGNDLERVQRDLDELAAFGFGLERHPYHGAAYRGPAERLCPDQIEYALDTWRIGRRVAVWNRVGSTNDLAARAAGSEANDGLVVLADEQTAGRGRLGRSWTAPARSSVLMSVLVFPAKALDATAWLTALGAVATAEVVAELTGRDARIKWPNDVRVDGRKIAGVLVERAAGSVIGIGLNANVTADDLGPELGRSATSLRVLTGEPVDRSAVARRLIERLDYWYKLGHDRGAESLSPRWRDLSEHLGRLVRVTTPGADFVGRLEDIGVGQALVLTESGRAAMRIAHTDVLRLVPADEPVGQPGPDAPPRNR
jgi:BirA family biotin operon repressor/biotin-[acetyl-CoA-carboxylase] ligase